MREQRVRVAVIGAGFGGLGMAVRLRQAGITDLVVLDRAEGVGGTWRHNTYPGSGCDVPSHLYSFSFQPKPDWPRRFATQAQILGYLEDVAARHQLGPVLRLGTEVTSARWSDHRCTWRLTTTEGPDVEADVVVAACGQLSRPYVPGLPGLAEFAGPWWHSARWDHRVDLAGRRVAVVGTGASAVQLIPHVVASAAHVDLYQRSAPYVVGKPDRRYPRWEQCLYARVPQLQKASRALQYLALEAMAVPFVTAPAAMALPEAWWRLRLLRRVRDPELRRRLTPRFRMGCKRILLANDYYRALASPTVEVVTAPVQRVTRTGVLAGGVERPTEALVFATGFTATDFLAPLQVTGRAGFELHQRWAGGARAYLGMAVHGFPNLFLLYGPNTNLGHSSIVYMLESQIAYVVQAVRALARHRLAALEVSEGAESAWDQRVRHRSASTVWTTGCSSWYVTEEGRNTNNWPGYTFDYRRRLRRLDLSQYLLTPLAADRAGCVAPG